MKNGVAEGVASDSHDTTLHGYMLLQTGKVRNYQNTDQGNQVQLTYVRLNDMYVISKMLIKEIKYN